MHGLKILATNYMSYFEQDDISNTCMDAYMDGV